MHTPAVREITYHGRGTWGKEHLRRKRQRDEKRSAYFLLALYPDGAAVGADNLRHQRQPQSNMSARDSCSVHRKDQLE